MPVKRKLNKKRTKVPRNVKINSKRPMRASQKKRGRSGRKSQRGGVSCTIETVNNKTEYRLPPGSDFSNHCCCTSGPYRGVRGAIKNNNECVVAIDHQMKCGDLNDKPHPTTVSTDPVSGEIII